MPQAEQHKFFLSPSALVLVGVNLIPLCGVLFWEWKIFDVFILFWIENVIIGLLNELRMATVLVMRKAGEMLGMMAFFALHYGIFTLGHGLIMTEIFGRGDLPKTMESDDVLIAAMKAGAFLIPASSLFASHFFSYIFNFLGRGEYKNIAPGALMMAPYARVVVLHIAILVGGFAVQETGESILALALLIILKIILDLSLHTHEHKRLQDY